MFSDDPTHTDDSVVTEPVGNTDRRYEVRPASWERLAALLSGCAAAMYLAERLFA